MQRSIATDTGGEFGGLSGQRCVTGGSGHTHINWMFVIQYGGYDNDQGMDTVNLCQIIYKKLLKFHSCHGSIRTVYPKKYAHGFCLLCFVVVIHWLIVPYPSGSPHWHCGNLTIAPVPAKQPWWIWINTSCEFIMNDCITTTKQSTTKPYAYFLGYTVVESPYNSINCPKQVIP